MPVSVDLISAAFKRDPYPTLMRMVEQGPVVETTFPFLGKVYMVTTHAAVNALLKDTKNFIRDPRSLGKSPLPGFNWWTPRCLKIMASGMIIRDNPDHRRLRILVDQAFSRSSMEQLQPRVEQITDDLLSEIEQKGAAGEPVDLVEGLCRPLPIAVISELLGLPPEDRDMFANWAERFAIDPSFRGLISLLPTLWKMESYVRRQIKLCRQSPRPGLLSALVDVEAEGQQLSDDEAVGMTLLLLFAGHATTTNLIGDLILELCAHSDQKDLLFEDWSRIDGAVEEALRYSASVLSSKPMYAVHDLKFHGLELERGDRVMALLSAANVDPAVFPEPFRFDILRNPNPHLAFGTGIHVCLGLKLARLETRVAILRLLGRFPKLELAVPREEIRWTALKGMRGPSQLPVHLHSEQA
ncbi:cytochrome P450 family protein [Rubinisphaera margarita]|uniref:cytochrome P450 family protein n=1 Tax=Rubinisphaera margarita TaxID=2909586 RepID=UPI001EE7AC38|nr:cytochrome P450 [Rubinisphaera margarita]MCG6156613.1 cytochrome P450 [Rubinisphaera margarita]